MPISVESPIAGILERAIRLRLTPEQQLRLRQLGFEFDAEAARLISERRFLEIEAQRQNMSKGTPLSLTSEQIALIDEKTAKLRRGWLVTLEKAIEVLSSDQQAKVQYNPGWLPSFEWDPNEQQEALDARVTRAVSAQVKDSKVLEIETAQAIVDRLLSWGKSLMLVIGVPLTLGVIVLGFLGYHTYSDFTSTVSSAQQKALEQINKAATQAGDQINNAATQAGQEFEGRAAKVREGYEKLEQQLVETGLPAKVQDLTNRLQHLEEIEVQGPAKLSASAKTTLIKNVENYRDYLAQIGYKIPQEKITITFDPDLKANAYYTPEGNQISADPSLIDDPETIYSEYTRHVLSEMNPQTWTHSSAIVAAMYHALAGYLPSSYEAVSKFGIKFVQTFANVLPPTMAKVGYLLDLENHLMFISSDETDPRKTEPHYASQPWAGAFWEIRATLSCRPDVARCERADRILLSTWASSWLEGSPKTVDQRFAQAIIAAIGASGTNEEVKRVRSLFQRRGLKLPS